MFQHFAGLIFPQIVSSLDRTEQVDGERDKPSRGASGLEPLTPHGLRFGRPARRSVGGTPIMLFWSPAIFYSAGYYLMAVADFMDGATALAAPAAERRRSEFKVIQGGK
jgi:hypothetical protein